MMLRRILRRLATVSAGAALLATVLPAASSSAEPSVQSQLAALRNATAPYHSLDAAEADGFVPLLGCFDSPAGGMGQHFFIPSRMGVVDLTKPTALVYEVKDNRYQLVAVEYIVPGPSTLSVPPLLGQPFTYLSALGVWKLHAWVWRPNPAGMFADYNPNVRPCPTG
jgi:hypothetical protein